MAGTGDSFVSEVSFRLARSGHVVPCFLGHAVSPFLAVSFSLRCFFAWRFFGLQIEILSCGLWARCALFLFSVFGTRRVHFFGGVFFRCAVFLLGDFWVSKLKFCLAVSGHVVPCFFAALLGHTVSPFLAVFFFAALFFCLAIFWSPN